MIKEAFEYLVSLAKASVAPVEVKTGDPRVITYLVGQGPIQIAKPEPPRNHSVDTLADLIELANRFADDGQPVIWVGETRVILVIDDAGHRVDTVEYALEQSDAFKTLKGLHISQSWHEQKAFIRLLRINFGRALAPGLLLDRVRKVRFENSQITTAEKTRDRESMGKDITSRVATNDEIPESVCLELPVFELCEPESVQCAVDVDPSRGLFQLIPFPDEMERAVDHALMSISNVIGADVEEEVLVYRGEP